MLTLAEAPAPEEFLFTCTPADLPESDRIKLGSFTAVSCAPPDLIGRIGQVGIVAFEPQRRHDHLGDRLHILLQHDFEFGTGSRPDTLVDIPQTRDIEHGTGQDGDREFAFGKGRDPFEVPRSTMVAPATGSPDSSATRPLTTTFRGGDWACAAMSGNRHRQASRAAMHFHPLCSGHNFLRQYVKGITIMEQLSTKL